MNNIMVDWGVTVDKGFEVFSYEDLNTNKEEWDQIGDDKKKEILQEALDNLPTRSCIIVDEWEEVK